MNGTLSWKTGSALGALFFAVCLGLGSSGLQRYDPRLVKGLADTRSYAAMVEGRPAEQPAHALRLLVPALASPIASIARGRIGTWNPEFLGLLIVNSFFVAWSALLLTAIGGWITGDRLAGIASGLLYLLTFNVSSLYLAGLVDSVESWAVIAAVWGLITNRWAILPLVAFIAAMGKETSVPVLLAFCIGWLMRSRGNESIARRVSVVAGLVAAQAAAIMIAESIVAGAVAVPWHFAALRRATDVSTASRVATLFNREWLYAFVWLAPLGLMRIRTIPREWVTASLAGLVVVLALGLALGVGGNVARPAFNAVAPALIVSGAAYLATLTRGRESSATAS